MSEDDFETPGSDYTKVHQNSQTYQIWPPNNAQTINSVLSDQEVYFEAQVKNVENIHKITIDSQYREICPVWKPALQNTQSIFDSKT